MRFALGMWLNGFHSRRGRVAYCDLKRNSTLAAAACTSYSSAATL